MDELKPPLLKMLNHLSFKQAPWRLTIRAENVIFDNDKKTAQSTASQVKDRQHMMHYGYADI